MAYADACNLEICRHDTSFRKWEVGHSTLCAINGHSKMFFPTRCDHSFAFREVPRMTDTLAGTFLFVIIMLVPFIAER
jgi:hypothetical protein